jgi:hypothetical protein
MEECNGGVLEYWGEAPMFIFFKHGAGSLFNTAVTYHETRNALNNLRNICKLNFYDYIERV